jgi:hypothetical protein
MRARAWRQAVSLIAGVERGEHQRVPMRIAPETAMTAKLFQRRFHFLEFI